ncbi:hypothetical protein K4F52_007057 [Lecanicillium sp. MT-2017a]|nr:hypothetical protein K4F52_007057 [Lecanicillium sp. MT-2017a]
MMHPTSYSALICAIATVFPSAFGQRYDDSRNPIRDFTLEDINEAIANPDASGEFSIPDPSGFDLSEKWPGTEVEGWKARIEIKANVPVSNDGYTTLTRISYVPPESVDIVTNASASLVATDHTWLPCSNLWAPSKLTASPDDVEGSCTGVLPRECTNDILESLQPNKHNTLEYMNIVPWNYFEELDVHDEDDDAFYREALERVWILGTAWGYSKYSEFANGTDLNINATITCLRAEEISSSGDENGGDRNSAGRDEEDSGTMQLVLSRWTAFALAVAWCALYL